MSEKTVNIQKRKEFRNQLASMVLAGALGASAGGFIVRGMDDQPAAPGVSAQEVAKMIRDEQAAKDFAASTAEMYTKIFDGSTANNTARMSLLNGTIELDGKSKGLPMQEYKNAIILFSQEDPNLKIDAAGHFLKDKYVGIREDGPNGPHIKAMQYDESSMSFKPDSQTNLILDAQVMAEWPIKGGPDSVTLAAFNPQTAELLKTPNGSPIVPGGESTMK